MTPAPRLATEQQDRDAGDARDMVRCPRAGFQLRNRVSGFRCNGELTVEAMLRQSG
jgi:hypothetical protein